VSILIFGTIFAILNRVRGGGYLFGWKNPNNDRIAKVVSGLIIGAIAVYSGKPWYIAIPLCLGLYLLGESFAWGKWVGSIAYEIQDKRTVKGHVELGIHWLADALYDENRRWYAYSVVALAIRGLVWWVPVFVYLDNPYAGVLAGVLMPACYALSHWLPEQHWTNKWGLGEIIYGAVYGALLGFIA